MHKFTIQNDFLLDGEPMKIISGSIHYFRVPPEYWEDRLLKLRALGANTVETYVAWNLHEPEPGVYDFSGGLDLGRFLDLAKSLGLWAIVRPSPYICAEWEFGGLPAWLLREGDVAVRTPDPAFMGPAARWYERLMPVLAPRQADRGGNILMFQVENEYGSYGSDKVYLRGLTELMRAGGLTQPFVTSDGPTEQCLAGGTLPGVHPTVNFGSGAAQRLGVLRDFLGGGGPLMIMELWDGWFDAWGGAHSRQDPELLARNLREGLTLGSANLYMFHGGTSFGFMNGGNYETELTPDVTSYDYAAPLSECGDPTPSYWAVQSVIREFVPGAGGPLPEPIPKKAYGAVRPTGRAGLFGNLDALSTPAERPEPVSMERLGQSYGFILYETTLASGGTTLQIPLARDRARLFVNGVPLLICKGEELEAGLALPSPLSAGDRLTVLVENLGRVNFGPHLARQRKGLEGTVTLDGAPVRGWRCRPLPLTDLRALDYSAPHVPGEPTFTRFTLPVEEPADTFLELPGYAKSAVFVNGRPLGRLWAIGPQRRLYLPAPWLRRGDNELTVFECDGQAGDEIVFYGEPMLE